MIGLTAGNPLALAWSLFRADAQDRESDRGDHFAASFCPHKDACLFPVSAAVDTDIEARRSVAHEAAH